MDDRFKPESVIGMGENMQNACMLEYNEETNHDGLGGLTPKDVRLR